MRLRFLKCLINLQKLYANYIDLLKIYRAPPSL